MSVTERLARFALDLRLEDLPEPVREAARLRVLDTLAVGLAGVPEECTRIAADVVGELGGKPAATLWGQRERTSAPQAAFVNGVASHALEYDDITSSAVTHTSACAVPAMLAMVEMLGGSGRHLVESYVVAFELSTRIGWGLVQHLLPCGWHPNGVLAAIGCAAAGSRLLGADLSRTRMAMGIGASCSSGIRKNVGTMTKPFHMGHGARNGVLAALLGAKGYTADPSILEPTKSDLELQSGKPGEGHGRYSFPETFVGPGHYDLDAMVRGLGELYELGTDSTITRFHPGSTFPQAAIDETLELIDRHDVQPDQVVAVEVGVTPMCLSIAPYGRPSTGLNARFSVPYSIAVAILDRRAGITQYTDERVRQPDVQALFERVKVYVPDDFANVTGGWDGGRLTPVSARVAIRLADGQELRGERHTTQGYPGWPPTWNDVVVKFEECAAIVLSPAQIRRAVDLVANLESLPNVRTLTAELVP
ncbi:MAG: MmgE/PrpD family protein [Chloroflexi bacterium]|nr:MmgE/PrpD family protein [Chloroflexota bacterium]